MIARLIAGYEAWINNNRGESASCAQITQIIHADSDGIDSVGSACANHLMSSRQSVKLLEANGGSVINRSARRGPSQPEQPGQQLSISARIYGR